MNHSEDTKRKISAGLKAGHELNPRSPETREKLKKAMAARYAAGEKLGFQPGNVLGSLLPPETRARRAAVVAAKLRGSGGHGRLRQGRPDHVFAKSWVIQAPSLEVFSFANLREWCRSHADLFARLAGDGKRPAWERAASKLASAKGQWFGWAVIEKGDLQHG